MTVAKFSERQPQTPAQIHCLIYIAMLRNRGRRYFFQIAPKKRYIKYNIIYYMSPLHFYLQYDTSNKCIYRWCKYVASALKAPEHYAPFTKYCK